MKATKVRFSSVHMNKHRFYQQKRNSVQQHMNECRFYQQKQNSAQRNQFKFRFYSTLSDECHLN